MEFGCGDDFGEFFHIDRFNVDDVYSQRYPGRFLLND